MCPGTRFFLHAFVALVLCPVSLLAQSPAPQTATPQPSTKDTEALELVKQGQKLNSEGRQDEALALYDRALQLSPNLYQAQLATGIALDLEGKYQQARQHLAKAIALATPEQKIQALRTMAVSYAFTRDASEAAKYEQQAFDSQYAEKKFDDAAGTANELARIYLASGDVDNAFQWYQPGHLTALLKATMTPAEKDLGSSAGKARWREFGRGKAGRKKRRSISQPPRPSSTKAAIRTRRASILTSLAMSRSTARITKLQLRSCRRQIRRIRLS